MKLPFPAICVTLALSACNRPTPEVIEPGTTTEANPTGPEDPTIPTTTDPTGNEWEGCLYFPESGYSAIQHQCEGQAAIQINFNIVGAAENNGPVSLSTPIFFGGMEDESYENPKVMACCSPPYDSEEDLVYQPHYKACYHDFVENGCRSLWVQLNELKEDVALAAKPQIQSLADWIAEHQQECYNEFWNLSGAASWTPANSFDSLDLDHVWELPSSAETLNVKDIEIEIENGLIYSINIPTSPIECSSQQDNNENTFLKGDPSDGFTFDLYSGDATLSGPGTPPFLGTADFTSASANCSYCSILSTEETEVGVWLHSLVLETNASAVVTNGTTSETVERARVALYAPVHADSVGSNLYDIPVGGALFVISAEVAGVATIETAYNAQTIELEAAPPMLLDPNYTWTISPFTFTYTDDNEDEWTLEIGTLFFTP